MRVPQDLPQLTVHIYEGRAMSRRVWLVAACVAAFAVAGALVAGMAASSQSQAKAGFRTAAHQRDLVGNGGESLEAAEEGPAGAAEAAYAARAYPAAEIPFSATLNAQKSWAKLQSQKGKNTAGQWTLAGPSKAEYPDVLTFSGASYTASGRVTALAIDPNCSQSKCRAWVGAAGGGIWATDHGLSGNGASWTYLSGSFATNAIGTLTYAGGALYAGTGEPNASGDSEAGVGLYKSTDGGVTWTRLAAVVGPIATSTPGGGPFPNNGTYTGNAFLGRSISSVVVDPTNPNHLYVASTRGVRGVSSVTGGTTSAPPTPRPPFGLFESTDGGTTWAQIKSAQNAALNTDRAEFAVTRLANGNTRMYVGDGNSVDSDAAASCPSLACRARFYRTNDARAATPTFTDLTTTQNIGYCTAQCWYDNVVYSPPGKPDVVYLGGSYSYGSYGSTTNGRAFIRSADAGASFADMTWDATTNPTPAGNCCQPNAVAPNGQHPDSHAIVEIPGSNAAIFGTDGGLMRSSGSFADISSQCAARGLSGANLALCQQLLSAVPTYLYNMNKSLSTLQFQSLSVAPDNPKHLQGGTQDNGTFETYGSSVVWPQIIYGDGGAVRLERTAPPSP